MRHAAFFWGASARILIAASLGQGFTHENYRSIAEESHCAPPRERERERERSSCLGIYNFVTFHYMLFNTVVILWGICGRLKGLRTLLRFYFGRKWRLEIIRIFLPPSNDYLHIMEPILPITKQLEVKAILILKRKQVYTGISIFSEKGKKSETIRCTYISMRSKFPPIDSFLHRYVHWCRATTKFMNGKTRI